MVYQNRTPAKKIGSVQTALSACDCVPNICQAKPGRLIVKP